ncbi:MAG: diaminopimelate epimerase [Deltaproteobacteria bacterium]|nr:diaminopimelate epimerase [Deltaproteobacteria bacterium]
MHGLGNDFIVLDLRKRDIKKLPAVVKKLSDRRFGIGFDQALILRDSKKADFRMDIYNNDGGRVEMCGNGIRCLADYIWKRGLSGKKRLEIETLAGVIRPERAKKGLIIVDMGVPALEAGRAGWLARHIPAKAKGEIIGRRLKAGDRVFDVTCVSMGNPHCVIFVKDVDGFPVEKYGPLMGKDGFFPRGTNVEFVEVIDRRRLKMRVWERGAGETLACGTGACAAAVASRFKGFTGRSVSVILKGGKLGIEIASDGHVYMTGPAEEVFEGTVAV